ncbi:hypothetical protein ACWF99_29605 [Nocardia sp. NPDC055002]
MTTEVEFWSQTNQDFRRGGHRSRRASLWAAASVVAYSRIPGMARSTTITISGKHVQISDEQIFLATRDQTPGTPQTYVVLVNDVLWPPTQLIRSATGVAASSGETTNYNSHAALKALTSWGSPRSSGWNTKRGER